MANHSIDLYYYMMSPPSRATLLTMRALGIKQNIKITSPMAGDTMKPEFLKLNPLHTIPAIDDGGFVLYDSNAIMKYLVDQYGKDDSLYPRDSKKGAIVTQRLFFGASTLFPRFIATHLPLFRGQAVTDEAKDKLIESFQYLETILEKSEWIAGDGMTVADISILSTLANIESSGFYDMSTYPNLWQWIQKCKSALSSYGYDEMQAGADAFGNVFKKSSN